MKPHTVVQSSIPRIFPLLTAGFLVLSFHDRVAAGTFTVLNSNDSGAGSLRQAIADANSGDTVGFSADLAGKTVLLQTGALFLDKDLTIDASGLTAPPTIDGNGPTSGTRVFIIDSGCTVLLDSLIITNGKAGDPPPNNCGGGIFNDLGTVTVRNCTISGSSAEYGGGIMNNGGTVSLSNSTVTGNNADFGGGGIYNVGTCSINGSPITGNTAGLDGGGILSSGPLTLINSTVSGNQSPGGCGGGIYQFSGDLILTNSTVSGNSSPCGGGIYQNPISVAVSNSTISGNSASATSGGGIFNSGGTLTIRNSTLSDNNANTSGGGIYNSAGTVLINDVLLGNNTGAGGPDMDNTSSPGTLTTDGKNLLSDLSDSGLSAGSTVIVGDPLLSDLGDHGGPTQTMYPLPGSPAIDAGGTTDPGGTDQRGFTRFFNGALDIGAVEVSPEIEVLDSSVENIPSGTGQIDFGSVGIRSTASRTITIRNTGTGTLLMTQIAIGDANASDFLLGSPGKSTLIPGENTTLQISFSPGAEGPRIGRLSIRSNDEDESFYLINLVGTGIDTIDPEIDVQQPSGSSLTDGSSQIDFGDAEIGSSVKRTFTVRNAGTANLTGLAVTRSGTNAADFSVDALGATSLFPGASTTFTVTFAPGATGARSASIQIASNDSDENPFDIQLTGTGVSVEAKPKKPEIAVTVGKKSKNLRDGRSTNSFQTTVLGATSKVVTFRIKNKGSKKLKNLKVRIRGRHSKDFLLVKKPSGKALAPGKIMIFKVAFLPTKAGNRKAELRISSNDKNENPFNVKLKGKGKGNKSSE